MCLNPIDGGGSVERIYQLSKHLVLAGEDCTILTTRQGWSEEHFRGLGKVNVVALPFISERFKIPLGLFRWLNKHAIEYDIIHLAMNWTSITAITYLYLRFSNRQYVYSAMGWLSINGRSRLIKHVYKLFFTKNMVRNASACIAVSKREVNDYISLGVEPCKVYLIPNGFTTESILNKENGRFFRLSHKIDSRPIILFIGRLNPIKGPDLLIRAFAEVSDYYPSHQLIIAGNDYGFLEELKHIVNIYKIVDRVTFLNPIFGVEKYSAYQSADVFVIPSRFDTMTIVALEAAASGTPVLLTRQCDFSELQEAGGGLEVEASVEGIKFGLRKLLSNHKTLTEIGDRGKEFVFNNYSWETICKMFIEVFKK
jgi:glycosyltransferase involved in cell wall biosynthesis